MANAIIIISYVSLVRMYQQVPGTHSCTLYVDVVGNDNFSCAKHDLRLRFASHDYRRAVGKSE